MPRLKLPKDAVAAVRRGHPWIYEDAVSERLTVGTLVRLVDHRDRLVGIGLADEGPIAIRVLGSGFEPLEELVASRVARAIALRTRVVPDQTNCFRLLNGAGDLLPGLVADRYDNLIVLRIYSAAWVPHLDCIVRALQVAEGVDTIYRRLGVRRVDGKQGGETLWGPPAPDALVVLEHGLKFLVRPGVGQKTGLFLDQRENRRRIGLLSRHATVWNLFGYNGGFSVYAAAGGAKRVLTVDLSAPALADARENFRLNGLDPDKHGFEPADVFSWEAPGRADVVVCDPPSLARGRRSDRAAKTAYRDLAARVGPWVLRDGLLATFSCTARLSSARWEESVREGLRRAGRWAWLGRGEAPPDHPVLMAHPEGRYLKSGLLRRL
jgi:23S rRNA (cytosine1962-C5)-methyltransferase